MSLVSHKSVVSRVLLLNFRLMCADFCSTRRKPLWTLTQIFIMVISEERSYTLHVYVASKQAGSLNVLTSKLFSLTCQKININKKNIISETCSFISCLWMRAILNVQNRLFWFSDSFSSPLPSAEAGVELWGPVVILNLGTLQEYAVFHVFEARCLNSSTLTQP